MKKYIFLLSLFVIISAYTAFPQEFPPDNDPAELQEPAIVADEQIFDIDQMFIITDFEFDITGRPRPHALIYHGGFRQGEIIQGTANLETYIQQKTQDLINLRVLKENVEIHYTIGEQDTDGNYQVVLLIKVEESWNIIAVPRPYYRSNDAFDLTIKARDYNFLGRMYPLRVDLGYRYDMSDTTSYRNSFTLEIESITLFRAFGFDWNFVFTNLLTYRDGADEPFYFRNITGLWMEYPIRNTTFTFGFEESFHLNEEIESDYNREFYGEDFQSGLFMSSKLFTRWEIHTGILVSRFGELTYTPDISLAINHEMPDPEWQLYPFLKGPFFSFGHALGFERINWQGNYREGLSVSITNPYTYDATLNKVNANITARGAGYFIITDFFAISTQLMYRHWFFNNPGYFERAGDVLRGISDKEIKASYMLTLNLDFPVRVLVFKPSEWLNSQKLRFFDFEFQISPVLDMAIYRDPGDNTIANPRPATSFGFRNMAVSSGIEFIAFPDFMRRLYLRLTFAWNLREMFAQRPYRIPGGINREISLMLYHHY